MIISKRKDGAMNTKKNINSFLFRENLKEGSLVLGEQVHGKEVTLVNTEDCGKIMPQTDGLITTSKEIVLGVMVADCLPVSFFSDNLCAIIHAGWKGAGKGIIEETLKEIKKYEKISALACEIGPGIGSCHFEVKEDLIKEFEKNGKVDIKPFLERRGGKIFLDLKRLVAENIEKYGLKNISISPICTFCNDEYFSFRRNRKVNNMIALVNI